ncbi:TVP38/TMEM64 family protein [Halorarum halobium]|uniref:TVP38/TMEM64 family protein n=1 Tax=Halorarum halobium TaxID=3075121 RepID=UPI0028AF9459|nr:TVP38/TMEM64 family protein [Halobaculum sp. XH14]
MTPEPDGSPRRIFRSAAHRRLALAVAGAVLGVALAGTLLLWLLSPSVFEPAWLRERIAGTGEAAPLVFVLVQTAQVIFAPVPGQVLGAVGGYLFGSVRGTVYSMLGVTIGSLVVFAAGRRYGRPFVARVLTDETLARFDGFVADHGTLGLFVVFLLPTFPDDAICLLSGLTDVRLRTFLVLLVVGRTPAFFATAFAGTSLANGRGAVFALVLAALLAISAVIYLQQTAILDALAAVAGEQEPK